MKKRNQVLTKWDKNAPMTVFGQKNKTSHMNGPNRLNRTETEPTREPENR
jgi:hypothetical protein